MGKAGDTSTAEVFRIYREFKRIQKEAGITPPDPTDKEAIRRGLYGDGFGGGGARRRPAGRMRAAVQPTT